MILSEVKVFPFYAIIGADTKEEAISIYKKDICSLEGIEIQPRLISEKEATEKWIKTY